MEAGVVDVPRIHVLSPEVVNRIAAGEVIQRPANAIKEMIENSLDAKSTQIRVTITDGGLKKIQIVDNGCGIRKEDLPIVCERFTTSKLVEFEDLHRISTYGFRGEALASISHVAHVSIISYPRNQECAYKAFYKDGKLVPEKEGEPAEPKPCAGVHGTTINVEDLFYQLPARRKAIKNPNDEYLKIVDVVTKYALHNSGIAFSVKKTGETRADVTTQRSNTLMDNIRVLYGSKVAAELIPIQLDLDKYGVKVSGQITNANYTHAKKTIFILFINDRLVENKQLKKGIEGVYNALFTKTLHPWIYLSIKIPPADIDVNVSPTKHEVKFLNQNEIISEIVTYISSELSKLNESRTFDTTEAMVTEPTTSITSSQTSVVLSQSTQNKRATPRPDKMVRTDCRDRTIQSFLSPVKAPLESQSQSSNVNEELSMEIENTNRVNTELERESSTASGKRSRDTYEADDFEDTILPSKKRVTSTTASTPSTNTKQLQIQEFRPRRRLPQRQRLQLTSVTNLLDAAKSACHPGLRSVFDEYVFVGCVNSILALVQYKTKLLLCNVHNLSKELFYQEVLHRFGELDRIELDERVPLHELMLLDMESPESEFRSKSQSERNEIAKVLVKTLVEKAEMLREYFSIDITPSGELVALPQIIDEYTPDLEGKLCRFVVQLAKDVEWRYEQECFDSIARVLAQFYALESSDDTEEDSSKPSTSWVVEQVLFRHFRERFWPPKSFGLDGTVVQLTSLEKLYKVFERC